MQFTGGLATLDQSGGVRICTTTLLFINKIKLDSGTEVCFMEKLLEFFSLLLLSSCCCYLKAPNVNRDLSFKTWKIPWLSCFMLFLMSLLPFLWQLQSVEYAVGHTYDACPDGSLLRWLLWWNFCLGDAMIACQSVRGLVFSLMCCGAHGRWVLLECALEMCF